MSKEQLHEALRQQAAIAAEAESEKQHMADLLRLVCLAHHYCMRLPMGPEASREFNRAWKPLLSHLMEFEPAVHPSITLADEPEAIAAEIAKLGCRYGDLGEIMEALNDGVEFVGKCPECGGPVVDNAYPISGGRSSRKYQCYRQLRTGEPAHGFDIPENEVLR